MRVLVTGANGQLGQALVSGAPVDVTVLIADKQMLDISDEKSVNRYFETHKPDAVINAAAYTAVDKAETETELALLVNARGAANLALATAQSGGHLVHVSTDFVFDGSSGTPYLPADAVCPINVYGQTKAQGEQAVADVPGLSATILRTAWVYSPDGSNFLTTMRRLMSERDEISVVADQIGTPTCAAGLAEACWQSLALKLNGIYHWTDAGVASWYDFAFAIHHELRSAGLLSHDVAIKPIPASKFPTAARRPACSVLDKTATWDALQTAPVHWRIRLGTAVESMLKG